MKISSILEKIKNESSKNGKLEILKKYKDNEVLKKVLVYTYSPLINYWVKAWKDTITDSYYKPPYEIDNALIDLDKLIDRKVTGNSAKALLQTINSSLEVSERGILRKIIDRDLECGISAKSINKVFPNLIPTIPYMRCSLTDKLKKINYPAIVQRKADGIFVNVVYQNGNIKFYTRNGTEFDLVRVKEELEHIFYINSVSIDVVLHGELLVYNDDNTEKSRKEGNGLINSLIKKEQTLASINEKMETLGSTTSKYSKFSGEILEKINEYDVTDNHLKLILWDCVPFADWKVGVSNIPYSDRFETVRYFSEDHVSVIDYKIINSEEEAYAYYSEQIERGYEGGVLKNLNGIWKDHTSQDQIKIKSEKECELLVQGIIPGTGKYEGGIGSLMCISSDGLLQVNVGSGLSDEDRGFQRVDKNDSAKGLELITGFDVYKYNGTIITVKFNELITAEGRDSFSMFLPRLAEFREDKNVSDNLIYIKTL